MFKARASSYTDVAVSLYDYIVCTALSFTKVYTIRSLQPRNVAQYNNNDENNIIIGTDNNNDNNNLLYLHECTSCI